MKHVGGLVRPQASQAQDHESQSTGNGHGLGSVPTAPGSWTHDRPSSAYPAASSQALTSIPCSVTSGSPRHTLLHSAPRLSDFQNRHNCDSPFLLGSKVSNLNCSEYQIYLTIYLDNGTWSSSRVPGILQATVGIQTKYTEGMKSPSWRLQLSWGGRTTSP